MNDIKCKIEEYAGHMFLNIYKLNKIKRQTNTTNEFLINHLISDLFDLLFILFLEHHRMKWFIRNSFVVFVCLLILFNL